MDWDSKNLFGSTGIKLPAVEGVESGCERELIILMNEVRDAFQWKHKDLLHELQNLKEKYKEKDEELRNKLTSASMKLKEVESSSAERIGYLKKENEELRSENLLFKDKINSLRNCTSPNDESYDQIHTLSRRLKIQQEEKCVLDDKYRKLLEKHRILQENYQKMLNATKLVEVKNESGCSNSENEGLSVNDAVASVVKNFCEEEKNHSEDLMDFFDKQVKKFHQTLNNPLYNVLDKELS